MQMPYQVFARCVYFRIWQCPRSLCAARGIGSVLQWMVRPVCASPNGIVMSWPCSSFRSLWTRAPIPALNRTTACSLSLRSVSPSSIVCEFGVDSISEIIGLRPCPLSASRYPQASVYQERCRVERTWRCRDQQKNRHVS